MATTTIIPLHAGKGRTVAAALGLSFYEIITLTKRVFGHLTFLFRLRFHHRPDHVPQACWLHDSAYSYPFIMMIKKSPVHNIIVFR
jgi:hypothetical protein